jgi:hypothetical protein
VRNGNGKGGEWVEGKGKGRYGWWTENDRGIGNAKLWGSITYRRFSMRRGGEVRVEPPAIMREGMEEGE